MSIRVDSWLNSFGTHCQYHNFRRDEESDRQNAHSDSAGYPEIDVILPNVTIGVFLTERRRDNHSSEDREPDLAAVRVAREEERQVGRDREIAGDNRENVGRVLEKDNLSIT